MRAVLAFFALAGCAADVEPVGGIAGELGTSDTPGVAIWTEAILAKTARPRLLEADPQGNLVIAGDLAGTTTWIDLEGDGQRTFYTAPDYNTDIWVAKLGPDGRRLWTQVFRTDARESVQAMAVDGAGNIFLAGHSLAQDGSGVDFGCGPVVGRRAYVTKLSPEGKCLFSRWIEERFSPNWPQVGFGGAAVGPDGSLALAGTFRGFADFGGGLITNEGYPDRLRTMAFAAVYEADGTLRFVRAYGGKTSDTSTVNVEAAVFGDVAVDGAGRLHIAGYLRGAADFGGLRLARNPAPTGAAYRSSALLFLLDSHGQTLGGRVFGSSAFAERIAVDEGGRPALAGKFRGGFDLGVVNLFHDRAAETDHVFVARFDAEGEALWGKHLKGTGEQFLYGLVVDELSNVEALFDVHGGTFTAGPFDFDLVESNTDVFVVKWSPTRGQTIWAERYDDSESGPAAGALAALPGNRLAMAGMFSGTIDLGSGPLTARVAMGEVFIAALWP